MRRTQIETPVITSKHYQIKVEGIIDPSWSEWFNGMALVSRTAADGQCTTTLTGAVIDQVTLRGLLNRLWDLNLTVCSIHQVDPDKSINGS